MNTNRHVVRNVARTLFAAAALFGAGCASADRDERPAAAEPRRPAANEKIAPSLTFEDQRDLAGTSLLAEQEKMKEENAKLAARVGELEAEAEKKEQELRRTKDETKNATRERDDLRRLLDESLAKEKGLVEQAAAAEIERLRLERQLVECKLAGLVRDGK